MLVGFPVGFFEGDFVVFFGGLDSAGDVRAAGDEGVWAWFEVAEVDGRLFDRVSDDERRVLTAIFDRITV